MVSAIGLFSLLFLYTQLKIMRDIFYRKISYDKIKINSSSNLIEMKLFLSFLKIDLERSKVHLGSCNGWTKLFNNEHELIISGGVFKGVEYLDSIKYKSNLHNPYNNFVSPFNLFDILNEDGKQFFFDYYDIEILSILSDIDSEIKTAQQETKRAKAKRDKILKEISLLKPIQHYEN